MINVSVNPTYRCNLRCEGCYLTKEQLSSRQYASIEDIAQRLREIDAHNRVIETIDIYGGEVSLLDVGYQKELLELLWEHSCNLNVITNLTQVKGPLITDPRTTLAVSYDFSHREQHEKVWNNMLLVNKDIHILTLATPFLVNEMRGLGVNYYIDQLNAHAPVTSFEIKPYSKNQSNQLESTDEDFEWAVKAFMQTGKGMNFEFINAYALDFAVNKQLNAYSDDHIYITPEAKFAVLEFDENDNEYFLSLDSMDEYDAWASAEKARVDANPFCGPCEYKGKCLSEHLRSPKDMEFSCNGFRNLLRWHEGV